MAKRFNDEYLKSNCLYKILSYNTGSLYLDKDMTAYFFHDKADADDFCMNADAFYENSQQYYQYRELVSDCYSKGAKRIVVYQSSKEKEVIIPNDEILLQNYYNNQLNGVVTLLKQTRKKSYLQELKDKTFIIPVKIKTNGNEIKIHYAIAKSKDEEDYLYVVFSDLDEYQTWAVREKGWEPMEIKYIPLKRICKHHGMIINPEGMYFLIDRPYMDEI